MAAGERSVSFSAGGFGVMAGMKVHTAAGGGLSHRWMACCRKKVDG